MYLLWYLMVVLFLHHPPNCQAYMKTPRTSTTEATGIFTVPLDNHHMIRDLTVNQGRIQDAADDLHTTHDVIEYSEVSNVLHGINEYLITNMPVPLIHKYSSTNYVAHQQHDAPSQLHGAAYKSHDASSILRMSHKVHTEELQVTLWTLHPSNLSDQGQHHTCLQDKALDDQQEQHLCAILNDPSMANTQVPMRI